MGPNRLGMPHDHSQILLGHFWENHVFESHNHTSANPSTLAGGWMGVRMGLGAEVGIFIWGRAGSGGYSQGGAITTS